MRQHLSQFEQRGLSPVDADDVACDMRVQWRIHSQLQNTISHTITQDATQLSMTMIDCILTNTNLFTSFFTNGTSTLIFIFLFY